MTTSKSNCTLLQVVALNVAEYESVLIGFVFGLDQDIEYPDKSLGFISVKVISLGSDIDEKV